MATVQKQIRQFNAMTRFKIIPLSDRCKDNKEAIELHDKYKVRKEVERASLVKSVSTMNIDRLMARGLRV